jgi:hypothetical protein
MEREDQYAIEKKSSFSGCFQWFCGDDFRPKIKPGVLSGYTSHVCLSTKPYPMEVSLHFGFARKNYTLGVSTRLGCL